MKLTTPVCGSATIDFIDEKNEIPEKDGMRMHRRPMLQHEDREEDVEEIERRIQERYARSQNVEYDEEATDVEQQALLPSVRDPKLWMVKCAVWGIELFILL